MKLLLAVLLILVGLVREAPAEVKAITEGPDNTMLIADDARLLQMEGNAFTSAANYKGSAEISSILVEQDGMILVGTETGLTTCYAGRCREDQRFKGIKVIQENKGRIWVAGAADRVFELSNRQTQECLLPSGQPANSVEAMTVDDAGNLWIGTRSYVARLQGNEFQIEVRDSAQALDAGSVGEIWIGSGHDLIRYQDGKEIRYSLPPPPANVRMMPPITSVLADSSGGVWVGTRMGLFRLNGQKLQKMHDLDVLTLFEDSKKNLWIGTSEGLNRLSGGKLISVDIPAND